MIPTSVDAVIDVIGTLIDSTNVTRVELVTHSSLKGFTL